LPYSSGPISPAQLAQDAQDLITLTNQDRAANGLAPLTVNPVLMQLAQERANAMAQDNYFSHDSPVYGWPIQMETKAGFSALSLGAENIAEGGSPAGMNAEFMNSAPHRANILGTGFALVGIGVAELPSGGLVCSELFSGPTY
jgi:uncharacterized protein YkwD